MSVLTRKDLFSLEDYSVQREDFRARVMAHKKHRRVPVGDHAMLIFEDQLTIQYQVQEMLRIEKIFEPAAIQEELDAYNPLIPDGNNWKAVLLIQYEDVKERKQALAQLIDIEDKVWVKIGDNDKVYAIADEDMERENDSKTSAVHFLRFELSDRMISEAKQGATIAIGIDHDHYRQSIDGLPEAVRQALVGDLH